MASKSESGSDGWDILKGWYFGMWSTKDEKSDISAKGLFLIFLYYQSSLIQILIQMRTALYQRLQKKWKGQYPLYIQMYNSITYKKTWLKT